MSKLYQVLATVSQAQANAIKNGNDEWAGIWEDVLDKLADLLPSGSGFDSGITAIRLDKGNLILETAFHHMNEHGFYIGWTSHKIKVTPDLITGFNLEIGGRNYRDVKDYIGDLFNEVLNEEVDLDAILKEVTEDE